MFTIRGPLYLVLVAAVTLATADSVCLPTVDLGYAIHQATINTTGNYYNFSNIRYAEPPVGDLRFSKPVPPRQVNRSVNDGQIEHICPQGNPKWLINYLAGVYNLPYDFLENLLLQDPRIHEDCLLLDVIVPKLVFDRAQRQRRDIKNPENSKGAPVLVWIYGGGFTSGYKTQAGNPAGLLARSQLQNPDGVIFAALNYRLGMFGWLAGPGVEPNLGLYDQRLALDWLRKYVGLFGGDPDRITVMGESGGGGSIMHQITAFGGRRGRAPFQQAIIQSPAFSVQTDVNIAYAQVFATASALAGQVVNTVGELRGLNFSVLKQANEAVIRDSPYGSWAFNPTVDGEFVPNLPGILLMNGEFDRCVKVMTGYNLNETAYISPPIWTNDEFVRDVLQLFPNMTNTTVSYIATVMYPDILDGTHGYITEAGRERLFRAELFLTCNTRYLALASHNQTYGYRFQYPPGVHGQDIDFTFFNGGSSIPNYGATVDPTISHAMQDYFVRFSMTGNPNGGGLPPWPIYGSNSTLLTFGMEGIGTDVDGNANGRCAYWWTGAYLNS